MNNMRFRGSSSREHIVTGGGKVTDLQTENHASFFVGSAAS